MTAGALESVLVQDCENEVGHAPPASLPMTTIQSVPFPPRTPSRYSFFERFKNEHNVLVSSRSRNSFSTGADMRGISL